LNRGAPNGCQHRDSQPLIDGVYEAPLLLNSISVSDNSGLRDGALLAVMVYSFARVSAASSR
jgi:hypothetical protein